MSITKVSISRRRAVTALVGAAAGLAAPFARAQAYPERPVRLIVPNPAGSSYDFSLRMISQRISESWGKPMVVDNRPGAASIIGVDAIAKAAPDGYTIGAAGISSLAFSLGMNQKLPYDAVHDLVPVIEIGRIHIVLVAHPSLGVSTLAELVALAKGRPGKIAYASGGTGSPTHFAMEMLKRQAGFDVAHIPYKGQPQAFNDTLAGTTQLMFLTAATGLPHIKSGKVRPLAVASAKRLSWLPDVPTLAESGAPGYEFESWFGIVVPKGTPEPIVALLNAQFGKTLAAPDLRERLRNEGGIEAAGGSAAAFASFIAREQARWPKIVRDLGLPLG